MLCSSELGASTVHLLQGGAPSFEDFSASPNNRFRTPERAAKNRMVPPGKVLHFFNLPADCDESHVRGVFKKMEEEEEEEDGGGGDVVAIKMFPRGECARTLNGLVEFGSVEAAVDAVASFNHTLVSSPSGGGSGDRPHTLKLCFSVNREVN